MLLGDTTIVSQLMNASLSGYYQRLVLCAHRIQQRYDRLHRVSTSELLLQIQEATEGTQLDKAVNRLQTRVWNAPTAEKTLTRDNLIAALSTQVLNASSVSLRLSAARWLRSLTQAGMISHPQDVFVTLVTAIIKASEHPSSTEEELQQYVHITLGCFLPFHFPYPAFTWEQFPANTLFYPLVALLPQASYNIQEFLFAIFAELPTLSDSQFTDTLLPLALEWANSTDVERRCKAAYVLARIHTAQAQTMFSHLLVDGDLQVRSSAKHAASYVCEA
ncbi:MAG: hypothetical protein NVSMB49_23810 [Ktedonobacteraceae bacterium]